MLVDGPQYASPHPHPVLPDSQPPVASVFQSLEKFRYFSGYETLDKQTKEVRILTLQPDHQDSIKCNLERIPLSVANPFYALSYCWGTSGETGEVIVNGRRVTVRKNLWNFLWHLRKFHGTSIRVWVDFLCINQQDISERNAQVTLMSDVFSAADAVFAWLGDSSPEIERAFDYLDRVRQLRRQRISAKSLWRTRQNGKTALSAIVDRPYLSRLWVIQEIILPENVFFLSGSRSTDWDTLRFPVPPAQLNVQESLNSSSISRRIFRSIREMKGDIGGSKPLHELMQKFHASRCRDPRDRLYGLLALTDPSTRAAVNIDYNGPILKTFIENYDLWCQPDYPPLYCPAQENTRLALGPEKFRPSYQSTAQDMSAIAGVSLAQNDLELPLGMVHDPTSFLSAMRTVYADSVLELEQIRHDATLRSQLTTMVFRGLICFEDVLTLRYATFAVAATPDSSILPVTNPPRFAPTELTVFVSFVKIDQSHFHSRSRYVLYTTKMPEAGDLLLYLGPAVLLARQSSAGWTVIEMGFAPDADQYLTLLPDPRHWSRERIPDAHCRFASSPYNPEPISDYENIADVTHKLCDVQLNGAAVAELVRTDLFNKSFCRQGFPTWDPRQFIEDHALKHRR